MGLVTLWDTAISLRFIFYYQMLPMRLSDIDIRFYGKADYATHISIGGERIVSKIGDFASYGPDPRRIEYAGSEADAVTVDYDVKYSQQLQAIKDNYAAFGVPYNGTDNDDYVNGEGFCCDDGSLEAAQAEAVAQADALDGNFQESDAYENLQFYYHADHLGSTSYITNLDGEVVQHIEYVPFGEVFIEERNNTWNTPYLFNAKEFDEETGLYYYGARYYDPRLGLWISTDAMEEKNFFISSYCFTNNSPINIIDYDGKDGVRIIDDEAKTITIKANYYVITASLHYRNENGKIKELKGFSKKDIEKMNGYNEYLNNLNLKVSSGEYEGYSVLFELSFIDAGDILKAGSMAAEDLYQGEPIGNTIQLGSEITHRNLHFETKYNEDGTTSTVGGVTSKNKMIIMNVAKDSKMNRIHEIFHTFGFEHPKGTGGVQGIMKYPPSKPSKLDAQELSTTKFLPTIKK